MSLLQRLFKPKKPVEISLDRLEQATAPAPDLGRPIRAAVYREAYVTYESGYRRKGVVMDVTESGLRIRFPTNELLPPMVSVFARSVGLEGAAEVVWQKDSEAGLRMLG